MGTYYNTTNLAGEPLAAEHSRASAQESAILSLFKDSQENITPSEAWKRTKQRWPLTSVRRAINTLTKEGLLRKTTTLVDGMYGKPEHCWTIASNADPR